MKPFIFKKLLVSAVLLLGTAILFQNCSAVRFSTNNIPILGNLVSNNSGNGGTYDGKLRILHHYVDQFKCEGKDQPESILIRSNTGDWSLIQNKIDRCGDRTGTVVTGVNFDDVTRQAQYDGKIYVAPKPYYVVATEPASLPDTNLLDGVCEDINGKCSLLAAIQQAGTTTSTTPVIVEVPAATFNLTSGLDIKFINSPNSVTIRGITPAKTVIDAKGITNHITLSGGGAISFQNITFINGYNQAAKSSSVIALSAYTAQTYVGPIDISNCVFKNNSGNPVLFIPTVMGKTSIRKSVFDGNANSAISTEGNIITMEDSIISNNNYIGFFAGAAYSTILIKNSSIFGNSGVGLEISNCVDCLIENVSIYNNGGSGLAVNNYFDASDRTNLTVNNSTIYNNALAAGYSISVWFKDAASTLILNNTIVAANNSARMNCPDKNSTIYTIVATHSLFDDTTCQPIGQGNIQAPANLLSATMNGGLTPTLMPAAGSAVIDAGDNMTCAKTDQRGFLRPASPARCDIGAIERP